MLTPAQIVPFLSHDDADVRRYARRYLVSAHDPAPATADDFWAAVDKVPPEEAGAYLDRLGLVPQTEASLRRLLDELPKTDPVTADSLRRTLERVDLDLLRPQWEAIQSSDAVSPELRQHLQARLDLANEPPEPLWDRMMELAARLGDRQLTEAEELEADRTIEAVSRHPDLFRDRVLAALRDEKASGGWAELFVTDIAGNMKLADAIPALLDKLKVEDGDLLWEVAADALVHIGSEDVVRQVRERFGTDGPGFQISAAEVLGRIKRPEAQAALVELLTAEQDPGMVGSLASALVDQCPDDEPTFATLRAIARDGAYDRTVIHLDEDLLALSAVTGVALPEAGEWRRQIEEHRSRWAMGMSNVDQAFQAPAALSPGMIHTGPLTPYAARGMRSAAAVAERPAPAARKPFRNAQPKVGRNDPCPCGSGKKFKKCCGK